MMETRNYSIDLELETSVENRLRILGTDINTLIKNVCDKLANNEISASELEKFIQPKKSKRPFEEMEGIYKGKIWIADDFNEPMEWIVDEME